MNRDKNTRHTEIYQRLQDTDAVTAALKRAARQAIEEHARTGHKVVVWRDNQVVWEDAAASGEAAHTSTHAPGDESPGPGEKRTSCRGMGARTFVGVRLGSSRDSEWRLPRAVNSLPVLP